jgi:hypothetical protein
VVGEPYLRGGKRLSGVDYASAPLRTKSKKSVPWYLSVSVKRCGWKLDISLTVEAEPDQRKIPMDQIWAVEAVDPWPSYRPSRPVGRGVWTGGRTRTVELASAAFGSIGLYMSPFQSSSSVIARKMKDWRRSYMYDDHIQPGMEITE